MQASIQKRTLQDVRLSKYYSDAWQETQWHNGGFLNVWHSASGGFLNTSPIIIPFETVEVWHSATVSGGFLNAAAA